MSKYTSFSLTGPEISMVLAAIRLYQETYPDIPLRIEEIATDGGKYNPLYGPEIDTLCERINFGIEILEAPPPPPSCPVGFVPCEYEIMEEVTYRRSMFVPVNVSREEVSDLIIDHWIEHGDPIGDFISCDERELVEYLIHPTT